MTETAHNGSPRELYPESFEPPRGRAWSLIFGPGLLRGAWMSRH